MAQRSAPAVAVDRRQFLLSTVEFDVLWSATVDRDGAGGRAPTPLVLRIASVGRTHRERRALRIAAESALRDRGVLTGSAPAPELAELIRLLAGATEQLELRVRGEPALRAVAAAGDRIGVLALRRADSVQLSGCDSLPSTLLAALPAAGPGPGRASTLPTSVLAAALAAPELVPALIGHGVPAAEARLLDRMLRRPDRQAQVVALRRDRHGELRRVGGVVGILDGPHGRYLLSRSIGLDGTEWSTVAPIDARRLRHRVARLLPPVPHRPASAVVPVAAGSPGPFSPGHHGASAAGRPR